MKNCFAICKTIAISFTTVSTARPCRLLFSHSCISAERVLSHQWVSRSAQVCVGNMKCQMLIEDVSQLGKHFLSNKQKQLERGITHPYKNGVGWEGSEPRSQVKKVANDAEAFPVTKLQLGILVRGSGEKARKQKESLLGGANSPVFSPKWHHFSYFCWERKSFCRAPVHPCWICFCDVDFYLFLLKCALFVGKAVLAQMLSVSP